MENQKIRSCSICAIEVDLVGLFESRGLGGRGQLDQWRVNLLLGTGKGRSERECMVWVNFSLHCIRILYTYTCMQLYFSSTVERTSFSFKLNLKKFPAFT